jgi:NAD(P)-dependent dehydrogenase (short-subunit alcohol dehydrogenase family)
MPRAALVTGASSGIGLGLAHMLGQEGFALTISGRRQAKLADAAAELRQEGFAVAEYAFNLTEAQAASGLITAHRERYGRLDVLVNNAGLGILAPLDGPETRYIDLQIDVNLRSLIHVFREAAELLLAAGKEPDGALVINLASFAGKQGQASLGAYSAAKAGVVGFTEAMNREFGPRGVKCCAFCPGYVDTPLAEVIRDRVAPEEMIRVDDLAEVGRCLLHLSRQCVIPEIMFMRPGLVE